jgi:hypothetical protein
MVIDEISTEEFAVIQVAASQSAGVVAAEMARQLASQLQKTQTG